MIRRATTPDERAQNPFKGTPFEQIFGAARRRPAGARRHADLDQHLIGQVQAMMQPHDGADELGRRRRHGPQGGRPAARPVADRRSSRTPVADAVRLADHWLDAATDVPVRRHLDRGLEPRRVDRRHHRRLEGAGRAGRRARRRGARQRAARGGPGDGRAAARHARQGRSARCSPPRSAPASARSPARCSPPPTSGCRSAAPGQGRAACPANVDGVRRRASTSARTTCCSTSPCARPPTSGSSPTCRGCAST